MYRHWLKPLNYLIDTTTVVVTQPSYLMRGQRMPTKKAAAYFIASLSAAILLQKLSSFVLGTEESAEWAVWIVHGMVVIAIALVAASVSLLLAIGVPSVILSGAFVAYGACILVGSFVLAGASLTLAGLHGIDAIPELKEDLTAFANLVVVAKVARFDCLRGNSLFFNTWYHALGGGFESLRWPIDILGYLQPTEYLAGTILFGALVYFGTLRQRWSAAVLAGLSGSVVLVVVIFGAQLLVDQLDEATQCHPSSIERALRKTAEDQVDVLVQRFAADVGRPGVWMTLTSVERRDRTLILKAVVSRDAFPQTEFRSEMALFRTKLIADFCNAEYGAYYRKVGISQVWIVQYDSSDLVETIVQSEDACRR